MPAQPPNERSLLAQIGAHTSWARTSNPTARTAPGRAALDAKFLAEAGGDPVRAEHLKKAHYARLGLTSARARRKAQEQEALAAEADAELDALTDAGGAE